MSANLSDDVARAAKRNPDGVALIEPRTERQITWSEFDEWVDRAAQSLLGRGMVAGQRVALAMANGIDLCVAYYGVLRCGMVAVPMNPRSTSREFSRMIGHAAPKLIVADSQSISSIREADTGDALIVVHRTAARDGELRFAELLAHAVDSTPVAPLDPESLAVIIFTSGATAAPRAVMLSHRALGANIDQLKAINPPAVRSGDVVLGLLPLFHAYGLNAVLGQAVRVGATVVLLDAFDPQLVLAQIRDFGITDVPVSPGVVSAWVDVPQLADSLASVRRLVSGATALDPDLARRFEESAGHVVHQGYGLTETAPVITTTYGRPDDSAGAESGSVGRPLPGIELELRNELGGDAAPGDPALIWVRGANLFSGYWPDGAGGPREDGWWCTGDLGFLDQEGRLVVVERLGDLITVSGFRVYPSEIEEVIAEVPQVSQVAVVGVEHPRTGEAVVAFVAPHGADADAAALVKAVQAHTTENLARFKQPSRVLVVDALPRSSSGAVAKDRLRDQARLAAEEAAPREATL